MGPDIEMYLGSSHLLISVRVRSLNTFEALVHVITAPTWSAAVYVLCHSHSDVIIVLA